MRSYVVIAIHQQGDLTKSVMRATLCCCIAMVAMHWAMSGSAQDIELNRRQPDGLIGPILVRLWVRIPPWLVIRATGRVVSRPMSCSVPDLLIHTDG